MVLAVKDGLGERLAALGGLYRLDGDRSTKPLQSPTTAGLLQERELPAGFVEWVTQLDTDCLPEARIIATPEELCQQVPFILAEAEMPADAQRDWLQADIIAQTKAMAALMKAPWMRLRLDVIDHNACKKFHQDAVTVRLICSYRGPGSQLTLKSLPESDDNIMTVPTGAALWLRGRVWPAETAETLLHRSPPIADTGVTRLVLVLDPVEDLESAF